MGKQMVIMRIVGLRLLQVPRNYIILTNKIDYVILVDILSQIILFASSNINIPLSKTKIIYSHRFKVKSFVQI